MCLSLAACGSAPVRKEHARLRLQLGTSEDVNGDERGRAAPVMVRVYELKSAAAFESADFFTLQNNDKKVLGEDLLAVDEFIMRPGSEEQVRRKASHATTAIGVLAGYRELGKSVWRATYKLPEAPEAAWYRVLIPDKKVDLKIRVGQQAVSITEVE